MTRRFYAEAAAIALEGGGFAIGLDGRPARTPGGEVMRLPVPGLADEIAAEWAAQEGTVRPLSMPLTRLAATAIDRIGREREVIVTQVAAYGASDLLCYRACGPEALARRQAETWQPLLDWCRQIYDVELVVTDGVRHVEQPAETLSVLRAAVAVMDDFRLAALSQLTAATGSLVLALAASARRIGPAEAVSASQLDEVWQAERWGLDAEAEARRETLAREIVDAIRFLDLLDGAGGPHAVP